MEDKGTAAVIKGNIHSLPLVSSAIDLIITSPPYFSLREYKENGKTLEGQIGNETTPKEYVENLLLATEEMIRVLKKDGSLWVNLGDKYARTGGASKGSYDGKTSRGATPSSVNHGLPEKSLMGLPWRYAIRCIDDLGLTLRSEVIWYKTNALPDNGRDRTRRTHEQWFHFTKQGQYYSNLNKSFPSVWSIPTEPLKIPKETIIQKNLPNHTATFPQEIVYRIITQWCPPGGVVLDPFGGSGTTALVAKALGCLGISIDLSKDYCNLANWRIFESGHENKWKGKKS